MNTFNHYIFPGNCQDFIFVFAIQYRQINAQEEYSPVNYDIAFFVNSFI